MYDGQFLYSSNTFSEPMDVLRFNTPAPYRASLIPQVR